MGVPAPPAPPRAGAWPYRRGGGAASCQSRRGHERVEGLVRGAGRAAPRREPGEPPRGPSDPPHARVHGSRPFPSPDASGGWLLPAGVLRWGRGGGGSREASLVEWGCAHPPPGYRCPSLCPGSPGSRGEVRGSVGTLRPLSAPEGLGGSQLPGSAAIPFPGPLLGRSTGIQVNPAGADEVGRVH